MASRLKQVVITSPGGRVGEIVKRSLEAHGLGVKVFEGPDAHSDEVGFIRELRKYIDSLGSSADEQPVLLPVFFPEVLAKHREEFPQCVIPLDDFEKIRLLDNKLSACQLVENLGIPQPHRFSSPDEVSSYPVVFKRTTGQGGDSVYFPRNKKALVNLAATAKEYLITDFIEGENWCTDCLRKNGWFRAASYRVIEPTGKGVSSLRETVEAPELENWCRKILESIDYHGVCGIDFRRGRDGSFYFLECNPRFSGGIETTLNSGFDIAWELLSTFIE